ncbi:MAG: sel1 repeat family protein [Gammaproteobacteria bacterium]|nr:sel1 repeat family protein [Gammaproteobacteria bacterium]
MRRFGYSLLFILAAAAQAQAATTVETADSSLRSGDVAGALATLKTLSAAGNANATTRLGALYQDGRLVPRDLALAARYYHQAAEQGDSEAQFNLGNMYLLGEGVDESRSDALRMYRLAADQGHTMAIENMRQMQRAEQLASLPPAAESSTTMDAAVASDSRDSGAIPQVPEPNTRDESAALALAREHGINVVFAPRESVEAPPAAVDSAAHEVSEPTPIERDVAADDSTTEAAAAPIEERPLSEAAAAPPVLPAAPSPVDRRVAPEPAAVASALDDVIRQREQGEYSLAFNQLKLLAADNIAEAQFQLAEMYRQGQGTAVDEAMAITLYRDAARQGHVQALNQLRQIYREAGVPMPDLRPPVSKPRSAENTADATISAPPARALESSDRLYTPAADARAVAATAVESKVEDQPAVADNPPLVPLPAIDGETNASATGDVSAPVDASLAESIREESPLEHAVALLEAGDRRGAANAFQVLAEAGNPLAQAHLGYMYYVGEGVRRDLVEAVQWYRRAAEQGNADAQYNLGVAYAFGEGVERDPEQAALWYQRASERNHALAQYSLGTAYAFGEGIAQDDGAAASWYRRAAMQNNAPAQYSLGHCYRVGRGVRQSDQEAQRWLFAAAQNGYAPAQFTLAEIYRTGEGVARDEEEANRWYRMAADQGHPDAQQYLAGLPGEVAP